MRIAVLLISLALAGSVHAADGFAVGHRTESGEGEAAKPMSWPYGMLQTARAAFDDRVAARAPGASLRFRLPKTDPAEPGIRVELVSADQQLALPMVSNTAFALLPAAEVVDDDARVLVNRHFRQGEYNHPNVEVRSPGLPEGVRRVGDLRLACEAQVAMAKAEGLKFRAVLATVSLFGFDLCKKLEIAKFDAPAMPWDSVTIEDGAQRLVLPKSRRDGPQLGDKAWSDNALVTYTVGAATAP
ncbi:hypothetical protein [Massilia sp. GCM10023247]|uniref:hypothetical protein n=1 Tax=Massilia sp. GCM10023247 TaxID=3252643 RepID=UPI00360D9EDE